MESFWNLERKNHNEFSSLSGKIDTDVCIIGGGLTGLTTAYYILKEGLKVTVLEKDEICSHTSCGTTGKITSQHGLIYKYLKESNGKEFAKRYFDANEEGLKNIENIIKNEEIECDFEKKDAYVFTENENKVQEIKDEFDVLKKLGVENIELKNEIDLPFNIKCAIKIKNQAQFNPVKYAYGLVNNIVKNGGIIYENSKVISIEELDDEYKISTQNGSVNAKYVVLATRYPIITFPGYYFMKMYQSTSYALIVDTHTEISSNGVFINSEVPQISIRTVKDGDKNLLLIVGYDYKTGTEIVGNPFEFLESKIKRLYPNSEVIRKWTAEDCISLDKIPYIGEFSNIMKNVYVATGFNKWGITTSNIAANIIRDKIIEVENKYEEIFKSSRLEMIKNKDEVMNMVKEAGEGIVVERIKGTQTPTCTHLGCKLSWNEIEETWDCPCHGSRFDKNGIVIESPASENLKN